MQRFFIKISLFLALIYVLLSILDKFYTSYFLSHKNVCEKSEWILNHKNKNVGIAFVGNSRVEQMLNINIIEQKTGKAAINLGLTGANYAENFLVLNEFLNSGNTIEILVIQVGMHSMNSPMELEYPFHNYNYMFLFGDGDVEKIYKDNNPLYRYLLWKHVPFARYMEFSSRFSLYKVLKGGFECKTSEFDQSKGSAVVTNKVLQEQVYQYVNWSIHSLDKEYLIKMINWCSQNNINVIMYTAPVYAKYRKFQNNFDAILDDVKLLAKTKKVPYFDYSNPQNPLCKNKDDFNDNIHMNIVGVDKLSLNIADSINSVVK